jgi:hypothetical protein
VRRLPRILLNVVTTLSLLLCVAGAVAWVRSYRACETATTFRLSVAPGVLTSTVDGLRWRRGTLLCSMRIVTCTWDPDAPSDTSGRSRQHEEARGYAFESNPVEDQNGLIAPNSERRSLGPIGVAHHSEVDPKVGRQVPLKPGERNTLDEKQFDIRLWLVVLLFAAIPSVRAVRFSQRWRRARRATGLCRQCGYDLRATPDRCPECGAMRHAASPASPLASDRP